MAESTIRVEVVFVDSGHVEQRQTRVVPGATVKQAIEASGIADMLPEGTVDAARVGIFSRKVTMDHVLREGDRIELYRPLLLDPMEARRRRAR